MIYPNSISCQQQLDNIEAIDYFMANQLTEELGQDLDQSGKILLFHLLLALQWGLRQGHSCLPVSEVADRLYWNNSEQGLEGFLFQDRKTIEQCLDRINIQPDHNAPLVYEHQSLYLRRYWQFEVEIATQLNARTRLFPLTEQELYQARTVFGDLFGKSSAMKHATDWQQVAVANSLGRRLSIISGGPGTGKTYTVSRLLAVLQAVNNADNKRPLKIQMAAPTGKAAQRLKESIVQAKEELAANSHLKSLVGSIPEEAGTLHRLLGYRSDSPELKYHAGHTLDCEVLLIDEASMIDLPMMARVLRALPEQAVLILLGDADQLPSVETGSVLADIVRRPHPGYQEVDARQIEYISSEQVPIDNNSQYSHVTLLTHSRRFDGEIGLLACEVIQADAQKSWQRLILNTQHKLAFDHPQTGGITWLPDSTFDNWLSGACKHYYLPISKAQTLQKAFTVLAGFRILVPTRTGERGIETLNLAIEQQLARLNPNIREEQFYKGRPVIVIQNSYSTRLFNGDVGLIWPDEQGRLQAWFETENQQYRKVSLARLPPVETVYAMTIHKTQGSEFNHVAIVLPQQETPLLCPELLYTGLTRAKEHLYVLASEAIWKAALKERTWRYSGLKRRLLPN